jgi:hypothetical protein
MAGQQPGRRMHGEVARHHTVEVVPAQRERDRDPQADPRAVRRGHGRAVRPGRVQEDLALPVVLDEGRGRQRGIKTLGPGGDGPGHRGRLLAARVDRHVHVQPLGPAGLDGTGKAHVGECLADQPGRRHRLPERSPGRWVDVQHQVGRPVQVTCQAQGHVVFHRPLVGQPEKRAPVVAQWVAHLAPGGFGPHGDAADPRRGIVRQVLLHERPLPGPDPDDRQRPSAQFRHDEPGHGLQVIHQVPLGRARPVEQRLIEMGQRNAISFRRAHASRIPGRRGKRQCSFGKIVSVGREQRQKGT